MILPIATLSLLSTLTVAAVETTQPSPSPSPAIATVLPADTPLVGWVNTKAEAWETLSRFQLFQTTYTAVSQFLPPDLKLDYAKDVESWLGDQVAFAFMPKAGSATASLDSSFLMLAPVKDDKRLQPFLDKLKADTQRVTQRQYKGITILEIKAPVAPPPSKPLSSSQKLNQSTPTKPFSLPKLPKPNLWKRQGGLAIAILPRYIVTGITAKPIEQLIDTSQKSATLEQNSQFQQTIQRSQTSKALFTLYENPATFFSLLKDISKDPSLPVPVVDINTINLEQIKEYSSVDGFVSVQPQGLRFQINAYRQTPKKVSVISTQPEKILTRMPAATYSAFTGRNLNQQWQRLVEAFSAKPELKDGLTTFRNFVRSSTGLDIDRDIIGWMDGEYAFFLFPTKGGLSKLVSPNFNLGIGMAVQTSNRTAADATLKKLDQFVKSFSAGGVAINTSLIKGQPVTSWELGGDSSQSLLAYSWVDNNTIIITTGFGAIADLVPQPYVLLPSTYNFTTATSSLPRPNQGYFYMNMGSFLLWVYGFVPPTFNDQNFRTFKQIIGTIHSVSATTSTTANREQFDFLVVLAPVRKQQN